MSLNPVSFSVSDIQSWTGARLANEPFLGRPVSAIRVTGVAGLAQSKPEHLAFFFSKAYQHDVPAARAGILITGEPFIEPLEKACLPLWKSTAVLAAQDPYLAMALISAKFAERQSTVAHRRFDHESEPVIHPTAIVDPSAKLGRGVRVGAYTVIEAGVEIGAGTLFYPGCFVGADCRIGEDCVLFPNVVLYEWTQVGNRVRLHAGVVLGADGFGYAPRFEAGRIVAHEKIYHLGRAVIGDDVEIGANSLVDRGTVSDTRVERGAKIDNNVQVGHNCHVDEGAVLCGMVGMAGSSSVGKFAYIGGLAGIGNQVAVGAGSRVAAGSLVSKNVPPGRPVIGFPARDPGEFHRIHAILNRLLAERQEKHRTRIAQLAKRPKPAGPEEK